MFDSFPSFPQSNTEYISLTAGVKVSAFGALDFF